MEQILVTNALNELKILNARIMRAIEEADFVAASKLSDKNARPGIPKEKFITNAKASQQSINDLITRKEAIKAAIIKSNAENTIDVAGQKMTRAKAIDTKQSIQYKRLLLEEMKAQYAKALEKVERSNKTMDDKIDQLMATMIGKENKEKISADDYEAIAKPYKTANEMGLVDPLGIKEEIDKLEKWIEDFMSEVDTKLQISNCTTYIEI